MKSKRELALELNKAFAHYDEIRLKYNRTSVSHGQNGFVSSEELALLEAQVATRKQELAEAREAMNTYNLAQITHNETMLNKRINDAIDRRIQRTLLKPQLRKRKKPRLNKIRKKKERKIMVKDITWTNLTKAQQTYLVGQYLFPDLKLAKLAEKIDLGNSTIYGIKALLKNHIESFNSLTKTGNCPLPAMLAEMQAKVEVEDVYEHVKETVETAQTPKETTPTQNTSEEEIELEGEVIAHQAVVLKSEHDAVLAKLNRTEDALTQAETELRTLHSEIGQRQKRFDDDLQRLSELEEMLKIAENKLKVTEIRNKELEAALEAAKERAHYPEADKAKALLAQERQFQKDLVLECQDRREVGQEHCTNKHGAFIPDSSLNLPAPVDMDDIKALISVNEILHKNLTTRLERATSYE